MHIARDYDGFEGLDGFASKVGVKLQKNAIFFPDF